MTLQESKAYILNEWDYEKNKLTPSEVSTSSHIKVWWRCSQNHSWEAEIANRYRKNYGCPYCAGNIPIIGVNDLFSTNPELEKSWDWDKNDELDPRTMKATSEKKLGGYVKRDIHGKQKFFIEEQGDMGAHIVQGKKF